MLWDKVDHTLVGNLTESPELRFTSNGTPVTNVRVASNRRFTNQSGQQVEDTTFMDVTCWQDLAEHVALSCQKGDRVIAIGDIRQRQWTDDHGQTRVTTFLNAQDMGMSLRWTTARAQRQSSRAGQQALNTEELEEQIPLPEATTPSAPSPQQVPPVGDDEVPF